MRNTNFLTTAGVLIANRRRTARRRWITTGKTTTQAQPTTNPFQKRSPPMKCKVCDCVLIPETFQSDGYEEIRFRCIQGCRGGEYWQVRRMPNLPPSRKVANFRTYKKMNTTHMGKSWKKIVCIICGKKKEGYMSSRTLT